MSRNFFAQVANSTSNRKQLIQQATSDQVIPPNAVFASVSMYSLVTGDITKHRIDYGPVTHRQVGGLDDPVDGYLYHDGTTLGFATPEKVYFVAPLQDLTVEDHEIGILLSFSNGAKAMVGQSIGMQDPRFREPFMKISVGEEGIWKKEFARLGKLDASAVAKQQKSAKRTLLIFGLITVATIVAVAVL